MAPRPAPHQIPLRRKVMDAVQITRVTVKVTMKHCMAWDDKEVKQEVSYIYQLVQDFFLHIISTNPKITRKDDLREKDRKGMQLRTYIVQQIDQTAGFVHKVINMQTTLQ